MSIKGSPYERFRRALRAGNLRLVQLAALELPRVQLADALEICLLMSAQGDERFDRAAARWLARVVCERPDVGPDVLRRGLYALDALPVNPAAARAELAALCRRIGLGDAAAVLERARPE